MLSNFLKGFVVRSFYINLMKDYKNYYIIDAPPEDVFIALTNPATIQLWSGEEAVMSTEPNSEFSLWEGSITGKNICCLFLVFRAGYFLLVACSLFDLSSLLSSTVMAFIQYL